MVCNQHYHISQEQAQNHKCNSTEIRGVPSGHTQGFQIGWDNDQSSKADTKLTGKVGQGSKNSYIPAYQAQSYVPQPEFKPNDDYIRQLYQQELAQKEYMAQRQPQSREQQYRPQQVEEPLQRSQYEEPQPTYQQKLLQQQQYQQQQYQQQQQLELQQQQQLYYQQQAQQPQQTQQAQYAQQQQREEQIQKKLDFNGGYPQQQQQEEDDDDIYRRYQQQQVGNSGSKHSYTNGEQLGNSGLKQQDDTLSQFSQMHLNQHKVAARKNMTSNIFNTDMGQQDDTLSRQSNRRNVLRKKEFDDTQHKGYGNFYNAKDYVPTQQPNTVNKNKIANQIFPSY